MAADFRVERDSMGELQVPASALWGAQTQRAVNNFPISGLRMPPAFIRALGARQVGGGAHESTAWVCCRTPIAAAIEASALEIANGMHEDQFPIDVFQTGSGTSSNMNANEVIARLATQALGSPVHANDHVNMSQSSNDSIPSAIHIAAALELKAKLLPAGARALDRDDRREGARGRRHREDGPHALDGCDAGAARSGARRLGRAAARRRARLQGVLPRLTGLAQGGTAVGTGINAHPKFGAEFAAVLAKQTGRRFPSGRGLLRGAEQPGHGGRAVRSARRRRP